MISLFKKKKKEPVIRTVTDINWLKDMENGKMFGKFYGDSAKDNPDYFLSAGELKEDYSYQRVYRYYPVEIPMKIEGKEVYSKTDGDWVKVGRLKRNAKMDGEQKLYLYMNEYKYPTSEGIEKEKYDPIFGVENVKTYILEDQ